MWRKENAVTWKKITQLQSKCPSNCPTPGPSCNGLRYDPIVQELTRKLQGSNSQSLQQLRGLMKENPITPKLSFAHVVLEHPDIIHRFFATEHEALSDTLDQEDIDLIGKDLLQIDLHFFHQQEHDRAAAQTQTRLFNPDSNSHTHTPPKQLTLFE